MAKSKIIPVAQYEGENYFLFYYNLRHQPCRFLLSFPHPKVLFKILGAKNLCNLLLNTKSNTDDNDNNDDEKENSTKPPTIETIIQHFQVGPTQTLLPVHFIPSCILQKDVESKNYSFWWFPAHVLQNQNLPLHPKLLCQEIIKQASTTRNNWPNLTTTTNKNSYQNNSDFIKQCKFHQRQSIWSSLDASDQILYPKPSHGRIPHFIACDFAANLLSTCNEFVNAKCIKVNPSLAQRPIRLLTLQKGKTLLMPSPSLNNNVFLYRLENLPQENFKLASTKWGAMKLGEKLIMEEQNNWLNSIKHIDLIVLGSLCVCPRSGLRLGKGEGWADLEWAILKKMNLINEETIIVTTVHDLQVVHNLPNWIQQRHDVPVDLIVTPTQIIRIPQEITKPKKI